MSEQLLDFARELNATLDTERLLRTALDGMTSLFGAERASFVSAGAAAKVERDGARVKAVFPVLADRCLYVELDGDERLPIFSSIARLVGTALENARLFEEQKYRAGLFASLVHDLRTPLQVIELNMGQLARGSDDLDLDLTIRDIAACTRRLMRMAQTTLELCTTDDARAAPEPRAVAVGAAVTDHLRLLQIVADAVEVGLASSSEPDAPEAFTIVDRLWIVLDNLVFNALKHAKRGTSVTVSVRGRDDVGPESAVTRATARERKLFRPNERLSGRPGSRYVEVSVHNHGPAISAARMELLFTELARDPSPQALRSSTGLGLSIVEQCVHHLGGAVWASSTSPDGTTFSFTLPSELA